MRVFGVHALFALSLAIFLACVGLIAWRLWPRGRVRAPGSRRRRPPAKPAASPRPVKLSTIIDLPGDPFWSGAARRRPRARPFRVAGQARRQCSKGRRARLLRQLHAGVHRRRLHGQVSRGRTGGGRAGGATDVERRRMAAP